MEKCIRASCYELVKIESDCPGEIFSEQLEMKSNLKFALFYKMRIINNNKLFVQKVRS